VGYSLSVAKWIHLNWGDEGLVRLFRKVFQQLVVGGLFVLEPQEWASYKKKKHFTEVRLCLSLQGQEWTLSYDL